MNVYIFADDTAVDLDEVIAISKLKNDSTGFFVVARFRKGDSMVLELQAATKDTSLTAIERVRGKAELAREHLIRTWLRDTNPTRQLSEPALTAETRNIAV